MSLSFIAGLLLGLSLAGPLAAADFTELREKMSADIAALAHETRQETGRPAFAPAVMAALATVPRHQFVPPEQIPYAYENRPLPIGYGQTIAQPYIVALMIDLIQPQPGQIALEIGTGSGYQAAVLAKLMKRVYTIEIIEPLAQRAAEQLKKSGYTNVETRLGNGYYGWAEAGPFDAIVVTAAVNHLPPPLIQQLKPGGRMVIPVGEQFLAQYLLLVEKHPDGTLTSQQILPVQFLPLTSGIR